MLASAGPPEVMAALWQSVVEKACEKGSEKSAFGHAGEWQWLQEAFPVHEGSQLAGAMTIVVDAGYIRAEGWPCGSGAFGACWRWWC